MFFNNRRFTLSGGRTV